MEQLYHVVVLTTKHDTLAVELAISADNAIEAEREAMRRVAMFNSGDPHARDGLLDMYETSEPRFFAHKAKVTPRV
jgi:hypothetical protein